MLDTDLISHQEAAFNIFLIGELLGIDYLPTTPIQTERYLINIKERIKRQQKQIAAVKKLKEALDGLNII
jgi:hypothetical protein